jgi:hypothetical protein
VTSPINVPDCSVRSATRDSTPSRPPRLAFMDHDKAACLSDRESILAHGVCMRDEEGCTRQTTEYKTCVE